jgi:type I pantothenate kinase
MTHQMALQHLDRVRVADTMYRVFSRDQWAALRAATPLTLAPGELAALRGVNEALSLDEVTDVYLPLSRLLNLHVAGQRGLRGVESAFLGRPRITAPYVIGTAGSVAVGKSTFARVLCALLSRWPEHPNVALVTTDGFLYPNRVLEERGLMRRKGFPESYDLRRLIQFLADLKGGERRVAAPVYSHVSYDIIADEWQVVEQPDILVFEGLNVLQPAGFHGAPGHVPAVAASDFFDFSIYLDAEDASLEAWYVERFLSLQRTAFRDPRSYFRRHSDLPEAEARALARQIWSEINLPNLRENILPTRERATVVLRKRPDHGVGEVWLRHI